MNESSNIPKNAAKMAPINDPIVMKIVPLGLVVLDMYGFSVLAVGMTAVNV